MPMINAPEILAQYQADGYYVARDLFSQEEVARFRDHFMDLRAQGTYEGDFAGVELNSPDPLKRYPRMIHMHRWDAVSLHFLLDQRLDEVMTLLLGRSPLAVQTMLYFKPPGARGQALHQDNMYLRVQPGTCMASWLALDVCDEESGCLQVVPGSHTWPVLCPIGADTTQSFTDITVPLPTDMHSVPVIMEPGDVLFFNGSLVHGSYPNTSTDRFRRALIGHYIEGDTRTVAHFYSPTLRMDGTIVEVERGPDGGACGVWVDRDGKPEIEMAVPAEAVEAGHE